MTSWYLFCYFSDWFAKNLFKFKVKLRWSLKKEIFPYNIVIIKDLLLVIYVDCHVIFVFKFRWLAWVSLCLSTNVLAVNLECECVVIVVLNLAICLELYHYLLLRFLCGENTLFLPKEKNPFVSNFSLTQK